MKRFRKKEEEETDKNIVWPSNDPKKEAHQEKLNALFNLKTIPLLRKICFLSCFITPVMLL